MFYKTATPTLAIYKEPLQAGSTNNALAAA